MKLELLEQPIAPAVLEPLLAAWRDARRSSTGALTVVRSSALVEDRVGSSFAGQFESYLGIEDESEISDRRARAAGPRCGRRARCATWRRTIWIRRTPRWRCWCSRSCAARAAGGGLSRTADGGMLVSATLGTGLVDRAR